MKRDRTYSSVFFVIILFILLSLSLNLYAEGISETSGKPRMRVMMAWSRIAPGVYGVNDAKVEAALAIALRLTGCYELIPSHFRDSTAKAINAKAEEASALRIAQELDAERILSLTVNRIKNILRVDIVNLAVDTSNIKSYGKGYAYLNYRSANDQTLFFEPGLLTAVQRAFADSENDSNMYASLEGHLRVIPAKTIAIGGMSFSYDDKQPYWDLFDENEVTSFDMIETIFEEVGKNPHYVAYDTESRDSVYLMARLYATDNSQESTIFEIEALSAFQVEYLITGNFKRVPDGASVTLNLLKINDKEFTLQRSENAILKENDLDKLRQTLRELTNKLL
jgi:hypothetical protein